MGGVNFSQFRLGDRASISGRNVTFEAWQVDSEDRSRARVLFYGARDKGR